MNAAIILLTALMGQPAATEGVAPSDCDRMAAHPDDPDRRSAGVEREQIDVAQAIAACEAQLATLPSDARARYQLARVLFYAGQSERANTQMQAAADAGYRQAQFVYGALVSNRREGAPGDICVTERYWLQAARGGRQAARVSYVRHFLNGRFEGCEAGAGAAEMADFLVEAGKAAVNYYERMLIEDLSTKLGVLEQRVTDHK